MARVARAVISKARKSSRSDPERQQSLYPSLNSMHGSLNLEDNEDEFSCQACLRSTASHLYTFTIASCQYATCTRGEGSFEESVSSMVDDIEVNEMREKLRFHFMNPFQKWKYAAKRRFPWKLISQLINMILVTIQLVLFAYTKFQLTDFIQQNQRTFVKLFILDPVPMGETAPIPSPVKTIYTYEEFFHQLNHTANRYYTLTQLAVGPYGYGWVNDYSANATQMQQLFLHIKKYKEGKIDPARRTFIIDGSINETTIYIGYGRPLDYLNETKIREMFDSILEMWLTFSISSISLDNPRHPSCFQFNIDIVIKNDIHSGNMPVEMKVDTQMSKCVEGKVESFDIRNGYVSSVGTTILDVLVVLFSLISTFQCVRSLVKSAYFSKVVSAFFLKKFNYRLKYHQAAPLFNMWFIGVIFSNILATVGSVMKIVSSFYVASIEVIDITSIILGVAVFAQWCGLLRFLSYFDKYNMLLLTLRLALPSVLRFIVCAGILYIAFLLCGWLVLGPYHPKFRNPSIASECLFSLVNGDDMYNTYIEMSNVSKPAWIFSKFYLYIFIALFIYVVLSLFISLISDTYETLHEQWTVRSKGLLQDFTSGQLGRTQQRSRAYSNSSAVGGGEDDEEYELIRDITNTPNYGSTEIQPLIANGGPELLQPNTLGIPMTHSGSSNSFFSRSGRTSPRPGRSSPQPGRSSPRPGRSSPRPGQSSPLIGRGSINHGNSPFPRNNSGTQT